MPVNIGGHSKGLSGGTSSVVTTGVTTTGGPGTVFSLFIYWYGSQSQATLVQDNKGNTYAEVGTRLTSSADPAFFSLRYECVGTGSGPTGGANTIVTATFGETKDSVSCFFVEVTGVATSSSRDISPAGANDSSSPYISSSGTTIQNEEIVIAYAATHSLSGTETITWGNSFSGIDSFTDADNSATGGSAYRIVSTAGSYNSSFTSAGAGTDSAMCWVVSYKAAIAVGVHASTSVSATTGATPASRNIVGGSKSIIVVYVGWYGTALSLNGTQVTDSLGNIYSQVGTVGVSSTDSNARAVIYQCIGGTGGTGVSISCGFSGSQDGIAMAFVELLGVTALDQSPAATTDLSTPFITASIPTVNNEEILLAFSSLLGDFSPGTITQGNSFVTLGDDLTNPSSPMLVGAYRITTTTGTYNGSLTVSGTNPDAVLGRLAAYNVAGSAPPATGGRRVPPAKASMAFNF